MQERDEIEISTIAEQTEEACLRQVLEVLSPPHRENGILIITGGCCHPQLAAEEAEVEKNVIVAVRGGGSKSAVRKIALADVKKVMGKLDTRITDTIGGLISKQGSAAVLPLVLINGNLAFYGGVPTTDQLARKLT